MIPISVGDGRKLCARHRIQELTKAMAPIQDFMIEKSSHPSTRILGQVMVPGHDTGSIIHVVTAGQRLHEEYFK